MSLVQTKYFPFKKRSPELGLPDDTTRTDVFTLHLPQVLIFQTSRTNNVHGEPNISFSM